MFMRILGQTVGMAKGLCFVTSQLKVLLWVWQVKGGRTKNSSSAVCVPVVFVSNIGLNTDTQEERRILSKDPEEMELLPCKPGWGASRRGELADLSLGAASSVSLHWADFLLWECFLVGGTLISPCQLEARQLLDSIPAVQKSQNKTLCHLIARAEIIYGPGLWSQSLKLL